MSRTQWMVLLATIALVPLTLAALALGVSLLVQGP